MHDLNRVHFSKEAGLTLGIKNYNVGLAADFSETVNNQRVHLHTILGWKKPTNDLCYSVFVFGAYNASVRQLTVEKKRIRFQLAIDARKIVIEKISVFASWRILCAPDI